MSMTREEAVAAYLKDRASVQTRVFGTTNGWGKPTWEDFNPQTPFNPNDFRLTPSPVPPGTLTWEEAKRRHEAGEPIDYLHPSYCDDWERVVNWFKFAGQHSVERAAYRLAPAPKLVPLGPEDVDLRHDLFRHSTVGPVGDQTIATRKNEKHIFVYDAPVTWEMAMKVLERSTDAGKSWRPCSKEVAS